MRQGLRMDVLARDRFRCRYCGRSASEVVLEVDHVLPRARGGADVPENLVTACRDCNGGKSNKVYAPHRVTYTAAAVASARRVARTMARRDEWLPLPPHAYQLLRQGIPALAEVLDGEELLIAGTDGVSDG